MKSLILAVVLFAVPVMAQDATTFAWNLSVSEPLDIGEGGGYDVYCRHSQSDVYDIDKIVCTVASGVSQCVANTSGFRGRHWCVADAFYVEQAETFRSDYSNEITVSFKPNPPGTLQKIATTAALPVTKTIGAVASLFGAKKDLGVVNKEWK